MYTHVLSMYAESTLVVCRGSKWILAHSYLGIVSEFLSGQIDLVSIIEAWFGKTTTTDLICT